MKNLNKFIAIILISAVLATIGACADSGGEKKNLAKFTPVSYDQVETVADMNKYSAETYQNGNNYDGILDNGIVNCVYYTLKINGIDVPVYSTRCAREPHSFVWVDAEDVSIDNVLELELTTKNKYKSAVVLPESSGVKATVESDKVSATLTAYGNFSFAFNGASKEALTVYVAPKEELVVPEGYEVVRFSPRKYEPTELMLSETKTVYVFEKGRYEISTINVPSDSVIWFEGGAYLEVYAASATDWRGAFQCSGAKNIVIGGRSLFDFSGVIGGDDKVKGVFSFHAVESAKFSGVISINSNSWTLCFTDSTDVQISRCMLFGFRTFSDGIMLSDCKDSGARDCFVRTGDDGIEIKSTGTKQTENILFEYNAVWADKARAYGAIWESNNNAKNVTFRNCSVGFAQATWSPYNGCLVIHMGTNKNAVWEDIHFEDIEVFQNDSSLINIGLRDDNLGGTEGGQSKNIYFKNVTSKRCYGLPVRIFVQSGGVLGTVYFDNIKFNNKALQQPDINDENVMYVVNTNNWSKEKNLKINTLGA